LTFKQHIKATGILSIPIIISQVGHIVTSMSDNIFLGFIGIEEQAAGILSGNVFTLLLVFSIGMSQGLTPLIAGAHVNNQLNQKASLLKNSLLLNFIVSIVLFGLTSIFAANLQLLQQPADVALLARPFIEVISFSLVPVTVFFTLKQYAEGLTNTRASMYISIIGNVINIALNYSLIYGKFGMSCLGYMGAAWATFWSRVFMALAFALYIFYHKSLKEIVKPFLQEKITGLQLKRLFSIGIGPALQFVFEVAAFALAGIMAGWLGKITLDAHGIALSIAAFTYMFTSGISGAASIRVANYKGLNDWKNIRIAGRAAFVLAGLIMICFAIVFLLSYEELPKLFNKHAEVIRLSSGLLLVAALFQFFDGVQVTGLGVLRGISDVKMPTVIALTAYWIIALPLAYFFGFVEQLGVYGIWYGLTAGLIFSAISLYARFSHITRKQVYGD
jgi:MATE family multidrug resistance protein